MDDQTETEQDLEMSLPDQAEAKTKGFDGFVVGIGASAGGLEALEQFFTHCPAKSGMAYVVVQHLSPDHKSMMLDLLARYTQMEVVMVTDGMEIKADTVYLIPAAKIMRLENNRFELTPKAPHTLTLPIDIFFNSMAESHGRHAVGVILSGTGSDGSRGAVAINAAGGFLLAQDPKTAKFDGMPSSVIGTGLVDAILPTEDLPTRLMTHIDNEPAATLVSDKTPSAIPLTDEEAYDGIVQLLLQSSGIDFHDYKTATILRRIERRMQVRHMGKLDAYFNLLSEERHELLTLKRELLIPVTNFFRDPEAFHTLSKEVVDTNVKNSGTGANIRIWISGTSTGEEAYSIGMLFMEAFERERRWPNLKIFATDVSQESIDFASSGIYTESAASEVTPERLERFFKHSGSSYEVKPELRQMVVFARHNLLSDPPFTQMDLVSCRNTLIYFTQDAQRKALQRLQFATRDNGFLFLGSSESLANGDFGFTAANSKYKIFQRTGHSTPFSFDTNNEAFSGYRTHVKRARVKRSGIGSNDSAWLDSATRQLIEQYSPPSMLVNNQNEIVHLFGNVQPYFVGREGAASLEINRVLPERMIPVASALMFKAAKDSKRMVSDLIQVDYGPEDRRKIRLSVTPVTKEEDDSLLLLSFEEHATSEANKLEPINVDAETMERVDILERELAATRESLQATIEELETSNEELQATNEELMASNEELQSSNEELQSVNEELNTVNAEYQEKVNILNRTNADLDSMAKAVGVATVFVDSELNLTRFSPDAVGLFKLRDSDIGRPLDEINNTINHDELMGDFRRILSTERLMQKEVSTVDNKLFLMRLLPYRFATDSRGVVATFVDITAFRDRRRLQSVLDALPEHIAVLNHEGEIAIVNSAWKRFAVANGDPSLTHSGPGINYMEVCSAQRGENADADTAYKGLKAVLEGSQSQFSMQYPCHSADEKRWFVMNAAPIQSEEFAAVVSHFNITVWMNEEGSE